jgi:dipeptidyl aminopeptidase
VLHRQLTPHTRVTNSGNATLFHGVPDWVYEEEVFSSNFALWWSPDSSKIAFLVSDETLVNEYTFPIYNPTYDANTVAPYPSEQTMRYPKPGYPNPLVSAHVFDVDRLLSESALGTYLDPAETTLELDWSGRLPTNDSIIMDVVWLANDSLLLKEVNRNADAGRVVLFDVSDTSLLAAGMGRVVRTLGRDGEEADEGWIETQHSVYPLPERLSPTGLPSYLDIVPDKDGFNHIALFNPASTTKPQFLTTGPWEVTSDGVHAVDLEKGLVYEISFQLLSSFFFCCDFLTRSATFSLGISKPPSRLPLVAIYSLSPSPSTATSSLRTIQLRRRSPLR